MAGEVRSGDDDAKAAEGGFHVVLVEPEIAGNTGAIGRTCVAAGATLWLVRPLGFRLDDRHRRRAGLDYWEHLDWRVVDHLDEVVAALGRDRLWSFSTKAEQSYTRVAYRRGDGLVFGPESRGLPGTWTSSRPDRMVRIPIRPEARSLNLGTAAAIALFEAARQVEAADAEGATCDEAQGNAPDVITAGAHGVQIEEGSSCLTGR